MSSDPLQLITRADELLVEFDGLVRSISRRPGLDPVATRDLTEMVARIRVRLVRAREVHGAAGALIERGEVKSALRDFVVLRRAAKKIVNLENSKMFASFLVSPAWKCCQVRGRDANRIEEELYREYHRLLRPTSLTVVESPAYFLGLVGKIAQRGSENGKAGTASRSRSSESVAEQSASSPSAPAAKRARARLRTVSLSDADEREFATHDASVVSENPLEGVNDAWSVFRDRFTWTRAIRLLGEKDVDDLVRAVFQSLKRMDHATFVATLGESNGKKVSSGSWRVRLHGLRQKILLNLRRPLDRLALIRMDERQFELISRRLLATPEARERLAARRDAVERGSDRLLRDALERVTAWAKEIAESEDSDPSEPGVAPPTPSQS